MEFLREIFVSLASDRTAASNLGQFTYSSFSSHTYVFKNIQKDKLEVRGPVNKEMLGNCSK